MTGKKVEKGAFVSVSSFGDINPDSSNKMTGAITNLLTKEFGLAADNIYVAYSPIHNWGWKGQNF